jgi:hypothetical protein
MVSSQSAILRQFRRVKRGGAKWRLHPLIYTLLKFNLARDVEKKQVEPRPPHFLSLNQDIVARSQWAECALKYVIYTPGGPLQH